MKAKGVAGLVAGLLLAGAAGAVLGHRRRKQSMAVPAKPETAAGRQETLEHAALREILERSVAYNDALNQRVSALETMPDAEARKAACDLYSLCRMMSAIVTRPPLSLPLSLLA